MRRALILGIASVLLVAAPARGQALVTLTTPSRFVDPAKVTFNKPPCKGPARPNALRVNVVLPDGYSASRRARWPVLYLLHGHGDAYDSWMAPCTGNLRVTAKGFPGIVVMPEAATSWYADWWNGGRRAGLAWERYYREELIPLIEKRFRVRTGRRWHAIAGLSMGGEGAIYLAEQLPGYLGTAASFSGPLSIQRPEYANGGMDSQGQRFADVFGPPHGFYATAHNPMANVANLAATRVYVAVGNGVGTLPDLTNTFGAVAEADLHQHADDFVAAARARHVDVTYAPRNGIHAWPYWRADLVNAIRWGLFKPVPERRSKWTLRTAAVTGDAWGFRWRFAHPPATLVTFSRAGRTLAASGAGRVTVRTPSGARFAAKLPFTRRIPARPNKRARH